MNLVQPLTADRLYRACDPAQFDFATTADLENVKAIIGQARAIDAIQFAIEINREGYNLYALGPHGTGKHTAISQYLAEKAPAMPTPSDWCYVFNFEQPHRPRALELPPGQSLVLQQAMSGLVAELFSVLPAAFASEEYQARRKNLEEEFKGQHLEALEKLREQAKERNLALVQTPAGFAFAPLHNDQIIDPDEFMRLAPEEQQRIETEVQAMQENLQHIMRQVPLWQREAQRKLKELNAEVVQFAITPLFEELARQFSDLPHVLAYLAAVRADVVQNVESFLDEDGAPVRAPLGLASSQPESIALRYQVNVLVSNGETGGAPVVYEDQPRYANLVGRVEHMSQMGALLTDFTLIKPGALHRANGGYLVLDARKLLLEPYAWDGLKHALTKREISIEALGQIYGLISTVSLEPEPIPLNVKVILIGERSLYYLLCAYEPEFPEMFKVMADFEDDMARDAVDVAAYAGFVATVAAKEGLRPFTAGAVARVVEHSSRLAGDAEKLSTHMRSMSDLLREADYAAGRADHEVITRTDVEQALARKRYHNSRVRERLQEATLRGVLLIETSGSAVGQVNALSVFAMGEHSFGRPTRVTASVRMGKGEVIDIERQVETGGPIHAKGVLILSGFLGSRYATERPLSLSASLVFEQSYGFVEGDSASSAELYALVSALADVPLKQSLAVTGSVNQRGQVQAIGGVNEKIEGFFDLCQARGLTGDQGVLIPAANVTNLMLRRDVVEAVAAGQFAIWPVEHVDQGLALLTGLEAGEVDEVGTYPAHSVNGRVVARIERLAETQRHYASPPARNGQPARGVEEIHDRAGAS